MKMKLTNTLPFKVNNKKIQQKGLHLFFKLFDIKSKKIYIEVDNDLDDNDGYFQCETEEANINAAYFTLQFNSLDRNDLIAFDKRIFSKLDIHKKIYFKFLNK